VDRSPLLELPGAVPAEGVDAPVAAHYGDPLREQRSAEAGCGLVDRSHRDVVTVSGADRLTWLHSLTSQHLAELPPHTHTEALVLSPHGHVEHHLVVVDDGTTTWLDLEPGTAPALLAFLDRMRFLLDVDPVDRSAEVAVLTLTGPGATTTAQAAGHRAVERPWGIDLHVPRPQLPGAADALRAAGAAPLGTWAWDALRVAARRPRLGFETDHRTIPHEVGWLATAVHLDKGCYRGQETVARVHNLGRPPRRLVLLHLDGSGVDLPASKQAVTWEGVQVGFVGTAARHHELGPVALALVKRNTPDSAVLRVEGDIAAAIDPEHG
jgi:tRNA-modifying protein YgfZ